MSLKQIAKDAHTKVLAFGGVQQSIGILDDLAEQCGAKDSFDFLGDLEDALAEEGLKIAGGLGLRNEVYVEPKIG